jgi:5'(3')-deoxyribonucleotidase
MITICEDDILDNYMKQNGKSISIDKFKFGTHVDFTISEKMNEINNKKEEYERQNTILHEQLKSLEDVPFRITTYNKQLMRCTVLIDDGSHNIDGPYYGILMDMPHNRDVKGPMIHRVYNWKEIYNYIHELCDEKI